MESEHGVPEQYKGKKLDVDNEVRLSSMEEAQQVFHVAAGRLLDVNEWAEICGPASADFALTDERGNPVHRDPVPGDFFRIDVPGPGPASGDGYDWVRIEYLEDLRNPGASEESITMRVRPAPSPQNPSHDTAHFFSPEATSSFRVIRNGNVVRAEVHGRNEVPNTTVDTNADKIRNAVVGTGAIAGLSTPQWKSLVNGLLESDK